MGLFAGLSRLVGRAKPATGLSAAADKPQRLDRHQASEASGSQEPRFQGWQGEWTPLAIRQAAILADSGDIRMAADLCEWSSSDDREPGLWETRTDAVIGSQITFEASGDGRRKNKPARALEAQGDFWILAPETELARLLKWGRKLGVGFARLTPVEHEGRTIPSMRVWHPRWFRYDYERRTWRVKKSQVGNEEEDVRAGDGKWVVFTPYGESRPWANAPWQGIGLLTLMKRGDWRDWSKYNEAHGNPAWVINGEKNDRKRAQLAAELSAVGRSPAFALDPTLTLDLIEAEANTWQTFDAKNKAANTSLSITILGGNLLSEVSDGQSTGATGQKDNQNSKARSDAAALSSCVHDQALTWWAEYNYGSASLAPWPFWHTDPPEERSQTAQLWLTVGKALAELAKAGHRVAPNVVSERFDIPVEAIAPTPDPKPDPARAEDEGDEEESEKDPKDDA